MQKTISDEIIRTVEKIIEELGYDVDNVYIFGDSIRADIYIDGESAEGIGYLAERECPDNSLECFEKALERWIDGIKNDLKREGEVVVKFSYGIVRAWYDLDVNNGVHLYIRLEMPFTFARYYMNRERYIGDGREKLRNYVKHVIALLGS